MISQHAPHPREFGEALARLRTERGISIETISDRTKISRRALESLEKGDFGALPGRVFARMFLRQVLAVLREPPDDWLLAFDAAYDRFERSSQSFPVAPSAAPRRRRLWPWLTAVALVVAGFVLVAFLAGGERGGGNVRVPATPEALLQQTLPPPTLAPLPTPTPTADPTPAPTVLVVRTGTRSSWVEIAIDGGGKMSRLMEPGAAWEVDAEGRAVSLVVGDAGEVEVEYLGQRRSPVGKAGEVVRLRLEPAPGP